MVKRLAVVAGGQSRGDGDAGDHVGRHGWGWPGLGLRANQREIGHEISFLEVGLKAALVSASGTRGCLPLAGTLGGAPDELLGALEDQTLEP